MILQPANTSQSDFVNCFMILRRQILILSSLIAGFEDTIFNLSAVFVCNHVTRRPCWWSIKQNFSQNICMKMEFSSQRRDILWSFTTSMSAMTSRTNQQLAIFSFSYVWDWVGVEWHCTMGLFLGTNLNPVFCVTPKYARKEEIASPKQSPCNSTQHRSNLTHDL